MFIEIFTYEYIASVEEIRGNKIYYINDRAKGTLSSIKKEQKVSIYNIVKQENKLVLEAIDTLKVKKNDLLYFGDYAWVIYSNNIENGEIDKFNFDNNKSKIFINSHEYKINIKDKYLKSVISIYGEDFDVLEKDNYIENLRMIMEENGSVLFDHNRNIHYVKAFKNQERYFAFFVEVLGKTAKVKDENNILREYDLPVNTVFRKYKFEELNDIVYAVIIVAI